jgi:hypothetical protein
VRAQVREEATVPSWAREREAEEEVPSWAREAEEEVPSWARERARVWEEEEVPSWAEAEEEAATTYLFSIIFVQKKKKNHTQKRHPYSLFPSQ